MDQCQIIPALHSLEGHESCQPACMLQLSALIPKPWQRIAHYASKVPTFRTKWSFQQHFPSRKEKLHYATLPFLAEQREPFVLCHSPTALEWGEKKKSCLFFPGRLSYSNTWIFTVSRRAPAKGEWSSTRGTLPPKNFPPFSFFSLTLSFPI